MNDKEINDLVEHYCAMTGIDSEKHNMLAIMCREVRRDCYDQAFREVQSCSHKMLNLGKGDA